MGFGESAADADFRTSLENEAQTLGADALYEKLKTCDPGAAERIHPNNIKRVIRALEINHITGKPMADFAQDPVPTKDYEVLLFGLRRDRKRLYDRIDQRVRMMFEQGLLEEVKSLKSLGLNDSFQSMQGIGYKEVLAYLEGKITYDTLVDDIQKGSRHYAKRQFTWFKRYPFIHWIDLDVLSPLEAVKFILEKL
jgi:tRNA dimethylallyltransferase